MKLQDHKALYTNQRRTIIQLFKEYDALSLEELKELTHYARASLVDILETLCKQQVIDPIAQHQYRFNSHYHNTLCIAIVRDFHRVHMYYQVYNAKDEMTIERDIIKKYVSISDIYDIIDTVLASTSQIHAIGISIPGILENGTIRSTGMDAFEGINIVALLKQKYPQELIIENDVNTAAVGLYLRLPQYENVAVLFQPVSALAGVGLVINGKLLAGKSHLAGEVQFLPIAFSQPDRRQLLNSPEGFDELITKYLQCLISIINPEAIGIVCHAVKDYTPMIERLQTIFPSIEDLPEIVPMPDLHEDNLRGIYALCKEKTEKE